MNFELPKQPRPWENKKSVLFDEWLEKEANLAPEKWSPVFLEYIEIKSKESEEKKELRELNNEEKREKTFKRYLDGLKLSDQELKEKKVLDVGCGNGEFVIYCKEKGITQKAYGADGNLKADSLNEEHRNNFFSKDFTEDSPIKNLEKEFSIMWELKPTDIRVSGKDKDAWLEQVLIIVTLQRQVYTC